MENSVIVHIGMHKTGTSFLQRAVFPHWQGVCVLKSLSRVRELFISPQPGQPILVTDERLSGYPFNGTWFEEFKAYVQNVHRIFPNALIIIGFRRHAPFLLSLYKQYLHEGGTENIYHLYNHEDNEGLIKREDLVFERRLQFLRDYFENILVYTQEQIRDNLPDFLSNLSAFTGISIRENQVEENQKYNVGVYSERQAWLLIQMNRTNRLLQRYPRLPTLYNRFFKKYDLTPQAVSRNKVLRLKSAPLRLPTDINEFVSMYYSSDWDEIERLVFRS